MKRESWQARDRRWRKAYNQKKILERSNNLAEDLLNRLSKWEGHSDFEGLDKRSWLIGYRRALADVADHYGDPLPGSDPLYDVFWHRKEQAEN